MEKPEVLELVLEEASLEAQRESLIEYQDKLDNARERSSQEGFTVEELKSLEAENDGKAVF